jgi:predicted DsbA family dithiol-disulfide isomerase
MQQFFKITSILFLIFAFINCMENNNTKIRRAKTIAFIDGQEIFLEDIDSIISIQLYEARMNALHELISNELLLKEANTRKISLQKYIETEINNKTTKVTIEDFNSYISRLNISKIDSNNIFNYLKLIKQKDRQAYLVDSLKQFSEIKIKLQPPFFRKIEMSQFDSHNLSENESSIVIYIVSDFSCPACQIAENQLKYLYKKYKNKVNFKFIYFSDYISRSALACEAAAKQKKFKQMHDIIFENTECLNDDSIFYAFAETIGLNIKKFSKDFNDPVVLKRLIKNKELILSEKIFSTPTFIVNNKILDDSFAIDYLEDVIIEEINQTR